jgi:hypothetical protein
MSAWPSHAATKAMGTLELIDDPPPMNNTAFETASKLAQSLIGQAISASARRVEGI